MASASEPVARPLASIAGERFEFSSSTTITHTMWIDGYTSRFSQRVDASPNDPKGAWWRAYLERGSPCSGGDSDRTIRTVDLYCGPGGLANGVRQFCAETGTRIIPELIVDHDGDAVLVYSANHGARRRLVASVASLLDFGLRTRGACTEFPYPPELVDSALARSLPPIDLVLAGPPCQGHSNLNNYTRREDPRNSLYLTVPAFVVAANAEACIIENVPSVINDSGNVVPLATRLLETAGYYVESGVISLSDLGWPQTRKRHFLIARRNRPPLPIALVTAALQEENPRSLWWAISDLEDCSLDELLDRSSEVSRENAARIDWLFDNDAYDLALPERPESHRNGTSYVAVYGRLRKDSPAQTITTGFMSPGQGRYVHPTRRRSLTAHEAARLQGFPDTYQFCPDPRRPPSRKKLSKWIGDAVPMPLGYAAALSALGRDLLSVTSVDRAEDAAHKESS